ncbi:MAG: hypothetical protein KatS3mg117_3090 [Geminicoccaceae bacterium]|jgi:hypothetical protein|nr:MAG: hypothetical protein KatS3mg117_3090 [Geminicoccaceae bacterium]
MSTADRLELRHARGPHAFNLAVCAGLVLLFALHALSGQEGALVLLLPAAILFGGFGLQSLLRILDRRPVALLDREGIWIPELMVRPLPWRELLAVDERRFGRTRLFLYVADTRPWLRPERQGGFTPDAALGKLLPGFSRPRITFETHWLDRSHREIREAVASFWGAARATEAEAGAEAEAG